MSSKKYVLNTNGKIIRTTIEESGNSITEEIKPVSATRDQIEGIQDFESIRTSGSVQTSTLLNLPIGGLNAGQPDNVISYDSEGLLHTDAFGGKKEEVSYYNSFNSIFTDENERKIYAEELEILAGFDVNSIGLINFSTGNLDLIKFTFLLDYVFEASFYRFFSISNLKIHAFLDPFCIHFSSKCQKCKTLKTCIFLRENDDFQGFDLPKNNKNQAKNASK